MLGDFLLPAPRSPLAGHWLLIEAVKLLAVLSGTLENTRPHVVCGLYGNN